MLGILGPSGAGKTTLLNALTLDAHSGVTTRYASLNNKPMTQSLFGKRHSGTQVDYHWAFLTARETVSCAVDLYLADDSKAEKKLKVEEMLKKTGSLVCTDTKVGNAFFQGLSGYQKRRLSLAVALIKQLQLIFLDEPTSGLNAGAAAHIMGFISILAREENLIIVATIHQPSTKVTITSVRTCCCRAGGSPTTVRRRTRRRILPDWGTR